MDDGKTVLVATHGGVIRALRCVWMGLPVEAYSRVPQVPNASVTVAEYDGTQGRFTDIGIDEYLIDKTTEKGLSVV